MFNFIKKQKNQDLKILDDRKTASLWVQKGDIDLGAIVFNKAGVCWKYVPYSTYISLNSEELKHIANKLEELNNEN